MNGLVLRASRATCLAASSVALGCTLGSGSDLPRSQLQGKEYTPAAAAASVTGAAAACAVTFGVERVGWTMTTPWPTSNGSLYYLNGNRDAQGNLLLGSIDNSGMGGGVVAVDPRTGAVARTYTNPTTTATADNTGSDGGKSAVQVGSYLFFTGDSGQGIARLDAATLTEQTAYREGDPAPRVESLATDGTFLYGNDDVERGKIRRYAIANEAADFTLTAGWTVDLGGRVRGLSYHAPGSAGGDGYVYAASELPEGSSNAGRRVFAIRAAGGTAVPVTTPDGSPLAVPGTTQLYQAIVAHGPATTLVLAVSTVDKLYLYSMLGPAVACATPTVFTSGTPASGEIGLVDAQGAAVGAGLYGIALRGRDLFVVHDQNRLSHLRLAVSGVAMPWDLVDPAAPPAGATPITAPARLSAGAIGIDVGQHGAMTSFRRQGADLLTGDLSPFDPPPGASSAASGGVIATGDVQMGIRPDGALIASDIGLTRNGTGDALSPGCACEGWGAGATGLSGATGGNGGGNMTQEAFWATADRASSATRIGSCLRVIHNYRPWAVAADVFANDVLFENLCDQPLEEVQYARALDWDVPPSEFHEYVTIQGADDPMVVFASDDGFATPFIEARPQIRFTGNAVDDGPEDHGAFIVLRVGSLAPGQTRSLRLFWGAHASEAAALAAIATTPARIYTLGQSEPGGGPATYFFAAGPGGAAGESWGVQPGSAPAAHAGHLGSENVGACQSWQDGSAACSGCAIGELRFEQCYLPNLPVDGYRAHDVDGYVRVRRVLNPTASPVQLAHILALDPGVDGTASASLPPAPNSALGSYADGGLPVPGTSWGTPLFEGAASNVTGDLHHFRLSRDTVTVPAGTPELPGEWVSMDIIAAETAASPSPIFRSDPLALAADSLLRQEAVVVEFQPSTVPGATMLLAGNSEDEYGEELECGENGCYGAGLWRVTRDPLQLGNLGERAAARLPTPPTNVDVGQQPGWESGYPLVRRGGSSGVRGLTATDPQTAAIAARELAYLLDDNDGASQSDWEDAFVLITALRNIGYRNVRTNSNSVTVLGSEAMRRLLLWVNWRFGVTTGAPQVSQDELSMIQHFLYAKALGTPRAVAWTYYHHRAPTKDRDSSRAAIPYQWEAYRRGNCAHEAFPVVQALCYDTSFPDYQ